MTLASQVVQRVRSRLLSGQRGTYNRLSGGLDASQTTVTFEFTLDGIQPGATFETDSEVMHVWSVDTTARTAEVERGWNGTTAAAHLTGALVAVEPRFPAQRILDEINNDLADLSSPSNGLFQVATASLTYQATVRGYDLTGATDVIDVLEVNYQVAGPTKSWPESWWSFERNLPTSDFASGFALFLHQGEPGRSVRVRYAAPFTALTATSQDIETVSGLPATALDIVELGATMRLTAYRDVKRGFIESQPSPRRSEDVPPGTMQDAAGGLRLLRRDRIAAERARLHAAWPRRRRQ